MGTRSRIAVMHGDICKSVYCHWDGYLEHNGALLNEHYTSAQANNLVALGDLSSLRPQIGDKHAFSQFDLDPAQRETYEKLYGDMCTFYGRDRGETGCEFKTDLTFESFIERVNGCGAEWYYIMRDGVWYVGNIYESDSKFYNQLVPLAQALETLEVVG